MKSLYRIFLFYILFLAFEPGVKAMSMSEDQIGCCSDQFCKPAEEQQSENKGCGDTNNCNPFQICCANTAFPSDLVNIRFVPISVFAKSYTEDKEKIPPTVTLDFWQPPKIA